MENIAADFIIEFNNPIEAEYELAEGGFDCSFELFAAGTVWGSISGSLSNQTDLKAALDLKADKTELNTAISELNTNIQNETTTRAENDTLLQNNINTLSQTVTANYNALDGKIDTEIASRTLADTTLQNNIDAEALARQNADGTLQGNIDTLSATVTSNYNTLDGKISDNASDIVDINNIINTYGDIVTYDAADFATSTQGALADSALQPGDNISALVNNVGYITSASLPTDYVPNTRTINGYALTSNITLNYSDVGALSSSTTINDLTTTAQQNALNSGATATNIGQITTNANGISDIQDLIPNQASSSNQLADKDFVNSSIATNMANFIGTFNSVAELEAYSGTLTNNDYAFVATTDSAGNTLYDRYKYNADTQEWLFEYELNNSSFTAQQWASINSGATTTNIGQIATNTSDISDLQTNKQDVLTAGANIQINNNVISATDTTYTAGTGISIINGVISNTQTSAEWGNITGVLSSQTDLQDALDDKYDASNPSGFITGITSSDVTTALGYTPYNSTNPNGYITISALNGYATETWVTNQGYITGITSSDVTTALGYTPYNATNPNGYITASALTGYATETYVDTGLATKQATLVSGTNIKTINNNSILGSGNLTLDGLPTQTGQSGKFLTTDGTDASWGNLPTATASSLGLVQPDGVTITIDSNGIISAAPATVIDNKSITENSNDELQTVGVIDQNNTSNAIKTWTGTKAQYDAIITKDSNTLYNITDDTDVTLPLLELLFPIGAVYFGTMSVCPLQTLGVGTWQALPQDKVIQIAGTRGDVNTTVNERLPNITGNTQLGNISSVSYPYAVTSTNGAFNGSNQGPVANVGVNQVSGYNSQLDFDASRSSSTYQDNAPVQPDAYLLNGWRRIA